MANTFLISLVIGFVLRQVAKFKDQTDWVKVKADMDVRVRLLMPGTWFDDDAQGLADFVLAGCIQVLGDSKTLEMLLKLLATENYNGAYATLKDLLLKVWDPEHVASKALA